MPVIKPLMKTSELSVLLVDKSDFEINTTKKWLQQLGITKIESANNLQKGLKLVKRDRPDIILCEYELKNDSGLELLKEIRLMNSYTPSFSIMTSNTAQETIVELLEIVPEDIFIKPFSPDSFNKKTTEIIKRYLSTKEIRKAIDTKDFELALTLASDKKYDDLASSNTAFSSWLEKTKLEIMLSQKRFSNVVDYAELLLGNKKYDLEWLRTYQLKAHYELGSYQIVIDKGEKIVKKYPLSIKAHILMGDSYYKLKKLTLSTKSYNRALSLSKNSISAQRSVSKVHHEIGDYETSMESYKKLMTLIERSVEKKAEDYYEYANLKKENAEVKLEANLDKAISEALNILKQGQKNFPDDALFDVQKQILDTQELLTKGKKKEALIKMNTTMSEFEHLINRSGSAILNSLITFQQLGEEDKVENLKIKLENNKVDYVKSTLDARLNSFKTQELELSEKINSLIRDYMKDFQNEQFESAAMKAQSALSLAPKSIEIVLKLLESKVKHIEKSLEMEAVESATKVFKEYKENKMTIIENERFKEFGKKLKDLTVATKEAEKQRRKDKAAKAKKEKSLQFEEQKRNALVKQNIETVIELTSVDDPNKAFTAEELENRAKSDKKTELIVKEKEEEEKNKNIDKQIDKVYKKQADKINSEKAAEFAREREKIEKEEKANIIKAEKLKKKTVSSTSILSKSKDTLKQQEMADIFNSSVSPHDEKTKLHEAKKAFEKLPNEEKLKLIHAVKITKEDLTSEQVSEIVEYRRTNNHEALRRSTFEIKKQLFLKKSGFLNKQA
ncbi:MAG: hypothetical protein CL760_07150 [Chloroflexi bacterium]|nr:hypothetical protein [Chloroflexota bacterium]